MAIRNTVGYQLRALLLHEEKSPTGKDRWKRVDRSFLGSTLDQASTKLTNYLDKMIEDGWKPYSPEVHPIVKVKDGLSRLGKQFYTEVYDWAVNEGGSLAASHAPRFDQTPCELVIITNRHQPYHRPNEDVYFKVKLP